MSQITRTTATARTPTARTPTARTIRIVCCSVWMLAGCTVIAASATQTAQARQTATLSGRVTDASGAPLAGATVEASPAEISPAEASSAEVSSAEVSSVTSLPAVSVATTDSDGRFSLALAAGRYVVRVSLNGFVTHVSEVQLTEGALVTIEPALALAPFTESTVVTATRSEKPLRDVPATLNLITDEDMRVKGTRFIGDELASVPGIAVTKNDEGVSTALIVRGVPSQHHNDTFLALLDGVPFVSANDEIDLETIPLDIVERVEVVKGPMSALYGRGSVSGAINYISKAVPNQSHALLGLTVGSYGHVRPSGSWSVPLSPGKNHLFVSGYGETRNGWRDATDRGAGNVFVKDHWFLGGRTEVILYANVHRYRQRTSSGIPLRPDGTRVPVVGGDRATYTVDDPHYERTIVSGSGVIRRTFRDRWQVRTTMHARRGSGEFRGGFYEGVDEEAGTLSFAGFDSRGSQHTIFVEPQLSWSAPRVRVIAGGSYERIRGRSEDFWTGQYGFVPPDNFLFYVQVRSYRTGEFVNRASWIRDQSGDTRFTARVLGAYAQTETDVAHWLTLSAGVRLDRFRRDVNYAPITIVEGSVPADARSDADYHASPKASVTVKLAPTLSAYGAFGEGFSPAFGPIFAFGTRDVNLRPEVARSVEGGIKGDLAGGRLSFAFAGYRLERRDLLLLLTDGPGVRTTNAGKQRSQGLEVDTRFSLLPPGLNGLSGLSGLSGYARYAYTDSTWRNNRFVVDEFTQEEIDLTGKRVARVPAHQWSVGATTRVRPGVAATVWFDYAGNYFVDGLNRVKTGRVGLLNASLSLQPASLRRFDFQLTATNLTNHRAYYYEGTSRSPTEAYPVSPFQLSMRVNVRLNR